MIWVIIIIAIVVVICVCANGEERAVSSETVIINGVEWATCNVDSTWSFAKSPEHKGKQCRSYYDCPSGWRLPTEKEFDALLDKDKVHFEKYNLNGTTGMRFVDKATGCSMFLPAAGRSGSVVPSEEKEGGYYWSRDFVTTLCDENSPDYYAKKFISFDAKSTSASIYISHYSRYSSFVKQSIRAVREK